MKLAAIAIGVVILFVHPAARAQTASPGSTTTAGDAAVSPATANPLNPGSSGDNRPSPGAGVASGVLNNGTTGDTIGTGRGTPPAPTAATSTSGRK